MCLSVGSAAVGLNTLGYFSDMLFKIKDETARYVFGGRYLALGAVVASSVIIETIKQNSKRKKTLGRIKELEKALTDIERPAYYD